MHDYKHTARRWRWTGRRWRHADHPADGFLTGVALFVAVIVLLFHVLALVPQ